MHQRGDQQVYQAAGMAFYLYLPTSEPATGTWPVLLFLHGVGEASWNYSRVQQQWKYRPIDVVKHHGSPPALCEARNPMVQGLLSFFIVVSPQYPYVPNDDERRAGRRSWHWVNQANSVDQIISIVIAEFRGDPNRIFVTGFSRGGLGALEIANLGNRIAKLVAVDSERIPGNLPDIPIWIHYGGPPTLENISAAHQPLVDQVGGGLWEDAPPNAPVPVSRRPLTTWNQNHTNTCIAAYSDSRIYEWLLREP